MNQPGFINQELLGLAHLKKLYSEYSHPPHPLSAAGEDKDKDNDKDKEKRQRQIQQHHFVNSFTLTIDIVVDKEAKLYSMLPLFCKIFNSVPPSVITEKFVEAVQFTQVRSNQ